VGQPGRCSSQASIYTGPGVSDGEFSAVWCMNTALVTLPARYAIGIQKYGPTASITGTLPLYQVSCTIGKAQALLAHGQPLSPAELPFGGHLGKTPPNLPFEPRHTCLLADLLTPTCPLYLPPSSLFNHSLAPPACVQVPRLDFLPALRGLTCLRLSRCDFPVATAGALLVGMG
jgi:hypothetical protein